MKSISLPSILLCGYERGGTTLLSELFRANGYESGFECGALLADSPSDFEKINPYFDNIIAGWKISKATREAAISSDFENFYKTLIDEAFGEAGDYMFFDKTPIYMKYLGKCLSRTEFINKAVVVYRDPRALFVSWAKRVAPDLSVEEAVRTHFKTFCNRYISYFIGSIAHYDSENVLFVSFEELVTREPEALKGIGYFANGHPFSPRNKRSRYVNVRENKMDMSVVVDFGNYLNEELQEDILQSTRIASIFFMDVSDRARLGDLWEEKKEKIETLLSSYGVPKVGASVNGRYFEPMTYLLRYADILEAGVNPVAHYRKFGEKEGRAAC